MPLSKSINEMLRSWFVVVCLTLVAGQELTFGDNANNFDDTILFKINWPGKTDLLVSVFLSCGQVPGFFWYVFIIYLCF